VCPGWERRWRERKGKRVKQEQQNKIKEGPWNNSPTFSGPKKD
jgi:hypothetical protein